MVTDDLLNFIRAQDARGASREDTKMLLVAQGGWTPANIAEAFAIVSETRIPGDPRPPLTPVPMQDAVSQVEDTPHPEAHPARILITIIVSITIVCGVAFLFLLLQG